MQTFTEYLEEGRLAPLYHGTTFNALRNMLEEGMIWPSTVHTASKLLMNKPEDGSDAYRGVSTTRNLKMAKHFRDGTMEAKEFSFVIELDQMKITHNFKILPIQYFNGTVRYKERMRDKTAAKDSWHYSPSPTNEYEEFILTKRGVPMKYWKAIHMPQRYVTEFNQIFREEEIEKLNKAQIAIKGYGNE